MAQPQKPGSLLEVMAARDQAEVLRDILAAEYERILEEDNRLPRPLRDDANRVQGRKNMQLAITAAGRALESIDQALRDMARADDQLDQQP